MGFPMGPEGIPSPAAKESYQTIPEGEPQRMQLRNIDIFAHVDAGKTTCRSICEVRFLLPPGVPWGVEFLMSKEEQKHASRRIHHETL